MTSGTTATYNPNQECPVFRKLTGFSGVNPIGELVLGMDDYGIDFRCYGDTSGKYMEWDASDDTLEFTQSKMTMTTATETASDPGRQIYLQRIHTSVLGDGKGLTGMEIRSTFNCSANSTSSEVKGLEAKARHTTGNTKTAGTFKGVIGNIDAKNGAVTTGWACEASIDVAAGGSFTTAAGFRAALNNSGTVTTSYGLYIDGPSDWGIGVYVEDATNAIQVGSNGTPGGDVLFYTDTAGSSFKWDQSEDSLIITCAAARAITSEDHLLDVVYGGTLGSAEAMVGVNSAVTPSGTTGAWACGVFGKVTEATTQHVSGYSCGGEFEINNDVTTAGALFPLVLNFNDSSDACGSLDAYIALRDYGSQDMRNFIWIADLAVGTTSSTSMMTTVAADYESTCSHAVRFIQGSTPTQYWFLVSNTAPS